MMSDENPMDPENDTKEGENILLALLRRRVSTTTHYCIAPVQQVKPITSSISGPIHMTIG